MGAVRGSRGRDWPAATWHAHWQLVFCVNRLSEGGRLRLLNRGWFLSQSTVVLRDCVLDLLCEREILRFSTVISAELRCASSTQVVAFPWT